MNIINLFPCSEVKSLKNCIWTPNVSQLSCPISRASSKCARVMQPSLTGFRGIHCVAPCNGTLDGHQVEQSRLVGTGCRNSCWCTAEILDWPLFNSTTLCEGALLWRMWETIIKLLMEKDQLVKTIDLEYRPSLKLMADKWFQENRYHVQPLVPRQAYTHSKTKSGLGGGLSENVISLLLNVFGRNGEVI